MSETPACKHHVLIIDDDQAIREFVCEVLGRLGYVVSEAADGAAGLAASAHPVPDVVLLDLTLPDMRGEEVLAELRRRVPSARIVVASGFVEDERIEELADGMLDKPFTIDQLVQTVRTQLQD